MKELRLDIKPRAHITRYVFGSAVYSDTPSDIDVAIIYDRQYVSVEDAIAYRRELVNEMRVLNSMMIDAILLSMEEEMEMAFLENAKYLEF
jgi:predicted nucleotidyltransferase